MTQNSLKKHKLFPQPLLQKRSSSSDALPLMLFFLEYKFLITFPLLLLASILTLCFCFIYINAATRLNYDLIELLNGWKNGSKLRKKKKKMYFDPYTGEMKLTFSEFWGVFAYFFKL